MMDDEHATWLRNQCGHDSRTVQGCPHCAVADEIERLNARNERLRVALDKERQRYMSIADRQAKRGKDEAAQEFWDKAEAIAEVLKP